MPEKIYYVYIATNFKNTVLYTGITNDLIRRIWEHKQKFVSGFTEQYCVNKLIYYEIFTSAYEAISREKQIKHWRRDKKLFLICKENSKFNDLSESL